MHLHRILTAIVLLPALIFLLLKGPSEAILLVAGLAALIGWHEYARMALLPFPVFLVGALTLGAAFLSLGKGASFLIPALWAGLFLFLIYFLPRFDGRPTLSSLLFSFAGLTYVALGFGHLFLLTTLPSGRSWLLFLLATVFGTDTGAFYTGKTMGRHRLIPRVSPKKTWEGAVGGLLLGSALGAVVGSYFSLATAKALLPLAAFLSVTGQLGDLLESLIKRGFGVKDSGSILPGHGGILDRTDALIFATPALYWILHIEAYGY